MGDWNDDGHLKAGAYRNGVWYVDWNGNNQWDSTDAAHLVFFGLPGDLPVMGDWNGDGRLKVGVYRNGAWFVDWNGNNQWDAEDAAHIIYFGLPGDLPVMGGRGIRVCAALGRQLPGGPRATPDARLCRATTSAGAWA